MIKTNLKFIILSAFIFHVSGCGFYNGFKLNDAVHEYKSTCFGSISNYCEYMLAETNILMMSHFKDEIDQQKDKFIEQYGENGYIEISEFINKFIDKQNEIKPNWFSRFFLSDAQAFNGGRNHLLSGHEIEQIKSAFDKEFGKSATGSSLYQSSDEYRDAYDCSIQSLKEGHMGGAAACVGNSRDPSELENQAYRDAERDFARM